MARSIPDALAKLESKGNAELSATADFIAGKFEFDHGNIDQARRYFDSALRFQPENSTVLIYYAALLVRTGNPSQALPYAQRAVSAAPDSPDAYTVLGYAQQASDRTKDAVASWKHSLELRPDPAVQQYLEKAQREQNVETDFAQRESSHFVLHYEGKQTSEAFRGQILAALESDYDDLSRDLGTPPRDNILVTLYTEQAFFDVTRAPSWSGALNDGKLRIPISGLNSMTPELARVLKHELAHSFINQISAGRCPPWLHEGIAQLLEPKSLGSDGHQLARLFKSQQQHSAECAGRQFHALLWRCRPTWPTRSRWQQFPTSMILTVWATSSGFCNALAKAAPPKPHCERPFIPITASSSPILPSTSAISTATNYVHSVDLCMTHLPAVNPCASFSF